MRLGTLHTLFLAAALATASVAAGCDPAGPTARPSRWIEPRPSVRPEMSRDVFQLEFCLITERLGLGEQPLDFWGLLDESSIAPEHRRLLSANGLRLGTCGELAVRRIEAMLVGRANVDVERPSGAMPTVAQGTPFMLACGLALTDMPYLVSGRDGALAGGELATASTFLNFQCLAGDRPGTIDLQITPWASYGNKEPQYRPMGAMNVAIVNERPKYYFEELRTRVRLTEGQALVIGPVAGRNLSVGEHLFLRTAEPYRYVKTVLMAPRLVAIKDLPPGTPVAGQISGGGNPDAGADK
jgi:hypothetical protein